MWTPLCISRWIFLLTLGVVVLCSASAVSSHVHMSCCYDTQHLNKPRKIKECYKQGPQTGCSQQAYTIKTYRDIWLPCIDPTVPWLKAKIDSGKLYCPPVISISKHI